MKTRRCLIIFLFGLLAVGLLAACSPMTTAMDSATVTAVSPTTAPTATSENNTASQQAAATVSQFLQSLQDDPSGASSLDNLSEPLRANVASGNLLTTLLGIDNMYRSFGVNTLAVDTTRGQAVVEAGLNCGSPIKRDFVLTEEAGNWLINTIISYSMTAMSLPEDRLASAQVIIDYYQALEDKQVTEAMALLAPLAAQNNETDVTAAAQEIQGITVTSLDLLQASPDQEVYSATFWVLLDSEDPGDWTTGSNMRQIELTHTPDGWRIVQVTDESMATAAACTLIANSNVPLYNRPALSSGKFGTLAAGEKVIMGGQTATGWLGFDPAVAQAANVGIFRLRWLAPGSDVTASGSCDTLPVFPAISPTACYEMAMADTPIYEQPMDTAVPMATLPAGAYTAVTGQSDQGWVQVNLGDGSLAGSHGGQTGWIAPDAGNFNGQSCNSLPVATP